MKRKRILFLTHRVPHPPNRGDRIRSLHLLKHLAARADVWLGCLTDEGVSEASKEVLGELCHDFRVCPVRPLGRWARAAWTLTRGASLTEGLFESALLRATVAKWAVDVNFDAVVAYCSSMAPYLNVSGLEAATSVVDLVDVDSEKWLQLAETATAPKRIVYQLEGRRLRKLECKLLQKARAVTLVSEAEASLYRTACQQMANVHAVPNGVDLSYFLPSLPQKEAVDCVFVGALDYPPNVQGVRWFTENVWPDVQKNLPNSRFIVVGRRPVKGVLELADAGSRITIAADVPDVRPYLRSAACVVSPLQVARGIQNKVLEAMAMGCPVVVSPESLAGIDALPDVHLKVAESKHQWVRKVTQLLSYPADQANLRTAARRFVEENHNWNTCLAPFDALLGLSKVGDQREVSASVPSSEVTELRR